MNPLEGNNFAMLPVLEALQLKAKVVTGYKSQQEALLAVAKGEVDITMGPLSQVMREVDHGVLQKPFLLMERERSPFIPDVPTFFEAVHVTPEIDVLYEQCRPLCVAVRMMAVPEDTPDEIVAFLRDASPAWLKANPSKRMPARHFCSAETALPVRNCRIYQNGL